MYIKYEKRKINLILQLNASQSVLIVKIVYGLSTNNQAYKSRILCQNM